MEINGIHISKDMNLCKYAKHYSNDFNHSKYLKEVFGTFNYDKVDYINDYGIRIEFKECLSSKYPLNRVRFAVYYKDYLYSDYIVFCYYFDKTNHIYLHKSKQILGKYKFDNSKAICQPYLSTIRKNYIEKFQDLESLKEYIDKIKKV